MTGLFRPPWTEIGQAPGASDHYYRLVSFSTIELLGTEIVEQQQTTQAETHIQTHIHLRSSQRGTPFRAFRVHSGHKDRS